MGPLYWWPREYPVKRSVKLSLDLCAGRAELARVGPIPVRTRRLGAAVAARRASRLGGPPDVGPARWPTFSSATTGLRPPVLHDLEETGYVPKPCSVAASAL